MKKKSQYRNENFGRIHFIKTMLLAGVVVLSPGIVNSQQFLNSLAVLFRSRPPWPTIYPPHAPGNRHHTFSKQAQLPVASALIGNPPGNNVKNGILIAQPMPSRNPHPFLPSHQQTHINTFPQHTPHGFFSSPKDMAGPSQAQFQPQFRSEIQFTPILVTTTAPPPVAFKFPDSSTSSTLLNPTASERGPKKQESQQASQMHFPVVKLRPTNEPEKGRDAFKSHYTKSRFNRTNTFTQSPKALDFKPSPMLLDSGTHYPNTNYGIETYESKKLSSFRAADAKDPPRYESGFKPLSYHQYASQYGTTASHEIYKNSHTQWNHSVWNSGPTEKTSVRTTVQPSIATTIRSKSREDGRRLEQEPVPFSGTPSSSEHIENWTRLNEIPSNKNPIHQVVDPKMESGQKRKESNFPVYNKNRQRPHVRVRPSKCEQFHRYGFCPVTQHYPLTQVEKIAARCSALLSHLIAPLPKTEVHYDIVMTKNTGRKTRRQRVVSRHKKKSKGWSWKDYRGSPICRTEEVKITPGWAKNEEGEWLVILQTEIWKQEAQISICSFPHKSEFQKLGNTLGTKCVQRFTAQRLAVLHPDNQEKCPVIRSVFLPSACICLSERISSMEDSTAGSVVPDVSSEESRSTQTWLSSSERFHSSQHRENTNLNQSVPTLIHNGTFTVTSVVTERSDESDSTQSPLQSRL